MGIQSSGKSSLQSLFSLTFKPEIVGVLLIYAYIKATAMIIEYVIKVKNVKAVLEPKGTVKVECFAQEHKKLSRSGPELL